MDGNNRPQMVISLLFKRIYVLLVLVMLFVPVEIRAQVSSSSKVDWIRPVNGQAPAIWGIRNGIEFALWPYGVEPAREGKGGGPRGLIRIGYNYGGMHYLINFIAVEPVVNGKMEFSEISPSRVDGKWGKLMWAGDDEKPGGFYPSAISRGTVSHPDPAHPRIEQLSVYVFMEQFLNGAHPYLKISVRSDRPGELCFEIFNQDDSSPMERCALTATMGNYSRLRKLYLKDQVIDSRKLYKGFDGIDFIEKEGYPSGRLLRDKNNDFIVIATSDESFSELSSWPQTPEYYEKLNWRYRPFFKVSQYWRKESAVFDSSLHVRVNGRAKYWSGGSRDKNNYTDIPGGPAFENFEFREKYYPGEKFYFGINLKAPEEMLNLSATGK